MRLPALAVLAAALLAAPAAAQREPVAAALAGNWRGSLQSRDDASDRLVTLPTVLDARPAAAPGTLVLTYVYGDGPGKTVTLVDTVVIDRAAATYRVSDVGSGTIYRVEGLDAFTGEAGTLVLRGEGTENDRPVEVRVTVTVSPSRLEITRDTRPAGAEWRMRYRHAFDREPLRP